MIDLSNIESVFQIFKPGNVYLIEKHIYEQKIIDHLSALNDDDKYLRFGCAMNQANIEKYVKSSMASHDFLFAVFNEECQIVAFLHMAKTEVGTTGKCAFEIGLSVDRECRGRGFGGALFKKAIAFATAMGASYVFTYCLRENKAMQALAKANDLKVILHDGEMSGKLELDDVEFKNAINNLVDFNLTSQLMLLDATAKFAVAKQVSAMSAVVSCFTAISKTNLGQFTSI